MGAYGDTHDDLFGYGKDSGGGGRGTSVGGVNNDPLGGNQMTAPDGTPYFASVPGGAVGVWGGQRQDGYFGQDGQWHTVTPSGAQTDVSRYRRMGAAANSQAAPQIQYGTADEDRWRGLGSLGNQGEALGLELDAAHGGQPSQAELLGRGMIDQSLGAEVAAAGSARGGPMQQAAAIRAAGQAGSQERARGDGALAAMRAQEMERARQGAIMGYGIQAQGYSAMTGQDAQRAQAQADQEARQRALGQAGQMGYEQLGFNVNSAQLNADTGQMQAQQSATQAQQQYDLQKHAQDQADIYAPINATEGAVTAGSTAYKNFQPAPSSTPPKRAMGGPVLAGGAPYQTSDSRAKLPATPAPTAQTTRAQVHQDAVPAWLKDAQANYRPGAPPPMTEAQRIAEGDKNGAFGDIIRENPYGRVSDDLAAAQAAPTNEMMEARQNQTATDDVYGTNPWLASYGGPRPYTDIPEQRAHGGPTSGRVPYLVGEEAPELVVPSSGAPHLVGKHGPELMVPDQDGFVIPAGPTAKILAAPRAAGGNIWAGGQPMNQSTGNMPVYGGMTGASSMPSSPASMGSPATSAPTPFSYGQEPGPQAPAQQMPPLQAPPFAGGNQGRYGGGMGTGSFQDANPAGRMTGVPPLNTFTISDDRTKLQAAREEGFSAGVQMLELAHNKPGDPAPTSSRVARANDQFHQGSVTPVEGSDASAHPPPVPKTVREQIPSNARGMLPIKEPPATSARGQMPSNVRGLLPVKEPGPIERPVQQGWTRQREISDTPEGYEDIDYPPGRTPDPSLKYASAIPRAEGGDIKAGGGSVEEDANRRLKASPYKYKDEYTPPEQERGEFNYGPMAQELEKNPLTATVVKKDPRGLRMLDNNKLLKVHSGSIANLQAQLDELKYGT